MKETANTQGLTKEERDRRVLELYEQVSEVEQRLIPTGLHVFGRVPEGRGRADLLRMVASFDRPEAGVRALPTLIAESVCGAQPARAESTDGARADSPASGDDTSARADLSNHQGRPREDSSGQEGRPREDSSEREARLRAEEKVDALTRAAVGRFLEAGAGEAGAWLEAEARVPANESKPVFELLARVCERLEENQELDSLARALRGEYVEPGPGADIVQNPLVLPTGRNTHAVNPYSIPSAVAFERGERVVKLLLDRHRAEHGRLPRAMALVLWGLDNIKTQGEGVAQALWLLGVRPLRDSLNRVTDVEPIPLARLGRPRIDVVMTVSGIFRDLFAATTLLLDKAVRRVAELDEPEEWNFVRANARAQAEAAGCTFEEASLRVFSNAPGSYGTNVNFLVSDSRWEGEDALADLFVTRKCFAYGRDAQGRVLEGWEARAAMGRALSRVEATYQNIDSFEIGITDVDHYFEYLGGVSKAVEKHADARPAIYLSDSLAREAKVRTLTETVRLETRAKTLNPKWYEGMLRHGFRGVAEIETRVTNTFGWSATADAVDGWVYDEVAETFVLDEAMLGRLAALNPHSARALVGRLLEAEGRGYWPADASTVERLREAYAELEDRLEGVA